MALISCPSCGASIELGRHGIQSGAVSCPKCGTAMAIAKLETQSLPRAVIAESKSAAEWTSAWRAAGSPPVDQFLPRIPGADQPVVLPVLISLEWQDRSRRGTAPALSEYLQRFPNHAELIRRMFLQVETRPAMDTSPGQGPPRDMKSPPRRRRDAELDLQPGAVLGDYDLLEVVGVGGMGAVYRALQRSADRIVALKVIRSDLLSRLDAESRQEWLQRFRAEAKAAAQLEHDHIVTVFDVGEVAGRPYFSMRYVEGESLADKIREQPLSNRQAAAYLEPVARAVHAAHQRQILHRDLKPSNVMVDARTDRPLVSDFGLAKRMRVAEPQPSGRADSFDAESTSGHVVGTPAYMSPEQALTPAAVTFASDVYSLGATLYHLTTGRPPFQAPSTKEWLRQIEIDEVVSPRHVNSAIDLDLETITLKCLSKVPARRYLSAEELGDDLRRYLNGEPIRARAVSHRERAWRWCCRNPVVATLGVAVVTLLILAAIGGVTVGIRERLQSARESGLKVQAQIEERKANVARVAALDNLDRERERLVQQLVASGVTAMERGDGLESLPWFAKALDVELRRRRPSLDPMLRLRLGVMQQQCPQLLHTFFDASNVFRAEFSPDGRRVVTASNYRGARVWDVESGNPLTPYLRDERRSMRFAAFLQNGTRLLTANVDAGNNQSYLQLWDANGQPITEPQPFPGLLSSLAMSGDGLRLAISSQTITPPAMTGAAQVRDAITLKPVSPLLQINSNVTTATLNRDGTRVLTASLSNGAQLWDVVSGKAAAPAIKPGETQLDALSPDQRAIINRLFGGTQRTLINPLLGAALSPDGLTIITAGADHAAQFWDAVSSKPKGPRLRHHDTVTWVEFSPDGRFAVTASDDKTARVWLVESGEPQTPPLIHAGSVRRASFSSDGRHVITASQDRSARVWDATSGRLLVAPLKHGAAVNFAAFNREASRIVTASNDGSTRLWAVSLAGPQPLQFDKTAHHHFALISPDGRRALLAIGQVARVWDLESGKPLTDGLMLSQPITNGAFSDNGRRVAVATGLATVPGRVKVYDMATGKPVTGELSHNADVKQLAFSRDNLRILAVGGDFKTGTASVWNVETGTAVGVPVVHPYDFLSAAFSPDVRSIVTGGVDFNARIWDIATGSQVSKPLEHFGSVGSVAFSPDGLRVLTGGGLAGQLWNARTAEPIGPPLKHIANVHFVTFSSDGRRAATASEDRSARIWDAVTGLPVCGELRHDADVNSVAFSPDNRYVVTTADDHTARVWDATTGAPVTPALMHSNTTISHARFNPTVDQVFTSSGLAIWKWRLPVDARSVDSLTRMTQWVANQEIDDNGGVVSLYTGDSMAQLDAIIEIRPDQWYLQQVRGEIHFEQGRHQEAIRDFSKAIELGANLPDVWVSRARAYSAVDELERTVADISRAIEMRTRDVSVYAIRARAKLDLGEPLAAIDDYTSYLKVREQVDHVWCERGYANATAGRWAAAAADFEKGIELGNEEPGCWFQRALAYAAAEDVNTYRASAQKLFARMGNSNDAASARFAIMSAVVLPNGAADYAPVLQSAERTLTREGNNFDDQFLIGAVSYRMGRFAEAVTRLQQADPLFKPDAPAETRPMFAQAYCWYMLAMAERRLGHTDKAREWLKKANDAADPVIAAPLKPPAGQLPAPWTRRFILRSLQREAQKPGN